MKRWQTLLIGIGVSALALFFVFRQADLSRIAAAFQQARYEYILLTALIYVGLVLIRGYRWHILTERRLSFGDAFWLFNIGFLLNNVLPAKLGEVARAVLAGRKPGMQFGRAASSVVVERLFDLVAVVTQLTVAILLLDLPQWATNAAVIGGVGSFTLVGVLAYAARNPEGALTLGGRLLAILPFFDRDQADDFLQPFIDGLAGVSDPRIFAAGLSLSLVGWFLSGVSGWVLMYAFWPEAPFIMGHLAVAAAGLGMAVPGAPSGLGTFHAAVVGVFVALGYDPDISRSYAFALHGYNLIVPSLFGLFALLREGLTFNQVVRAAQDAQDEQPAPTVP